MRLKHFAKKEVSGLYFSLLDLVDAEEKLGHKTCIQEPSGETLWGDPGGEWDVELVHSQLPISSYCTRKPRLLWCHGEPLSSVGNGVSMKALCDLAPACDAFICMRQEELAYWNLIKRTYVVPKGINLDRFKPLPITEVGEKLSGSPSVLYMEHWRGQRNPLTLVVAMQKVFQQYPNARLHLYNCTDKRMLETFQAVSKQGKLFPYLRSLQGPVSPSEVNKLINRCDIVVSCLFPFYARSIEALGAGKAFLCPGYEDPEYKFHCRLDPDDMARAIIDIWENGCGKFDFRAWAEKKHCAKEMARQACKIYEKFL